MRRVSSNYGAYLEYSVYNESSQKDGEYSEVWEETQKMKAKGQYAKDKKVGKWLFGGKEGQLSAMEEVYENDIRRSKKILVTSDFNGNYFEISNYNEREQKDGEYLEVWEKSGKIKTKGQYEKNKKVGKWLFNGKKEGELSPIEEVYENNYCRSMKTFVSSDSGNYFKLYNYDEREQKDGEYLEIWEKSGKTKAKGQYEKGQEQGVWTTYDQQGKLLTETLYKDGKVVKKDEEKK
jgi:antitoxin component YwqK of YwqJK toxin-antitoxin module